MTLSIDYAKYILEFNYMHGQYADGKSHPSVMQSESGFKVMGEANCTASANDCMNNRLATSVSTEGYIQKGGRAHT